MLLYLMEPEVCGRLYRSRRRDFIPSKFVFPSLPYLTRMSQYKGTCVDIRPVYGQRKFSVCVHYVRLQRHYTKREEHLFGHSYPTVEITRSQDPLPSHTVLTQSVGPQSRVLPRRT